jgi:hypothetical protein
MKTYPKIPYNNEKLYGLETWAFYKYDGSNIRFEWNKKRGWYKFGTRTQLISPTEPIYGKGIDVFLNKYGDDLSKIFYSKYKNIDSIVVFGEYFGQNSFAGKHSDSDEMDVVIFDISLYKKGFITPKEFINNFGSLDIAKLIYNGEYNEDFVNSIKQNKLDLLEGVVCKGAIKTKKEGELIWMSKIKTDKWLASVKDIYGDKRLVEEFS